MWEATARDISSPVVQLPGFGQLALAADGTVDTAQVRECARIRQAIEHLGMT